MKAEESRKKIRAKKNKNKTRAEMSEKSVKNIIYQIRYNAFRIL